MVELLQSGDIVLMSALKAALAELDIPVIEFDGPVADLYAAVIPRRLMVHEDDLAEARRVARELCPEVLPPAAEDARSSPPPSLGHEGLIEGG